MLYEVLNQSSIKNYPGFLDSFDYILTDCDGVLWLNDEEIPGAAKALQYFRKRGKKIIFVTNNSTKSVQQYMKKFNKLNIEAHSDEVFPTSYCAALYLQSVDFSKKAYLIGSVGISDEFDRAGITYLPLGPDPYCDEMAANLEGANFTDSEIGAVVVGFDAHISYVKLLKAATYLRDPNCIFIGTNTDEQFPSTNSNIVIPGTGVMVIAVSTAAKRNPVIVGKPYKFMFDCIKRVHPDIDSSRCLMIGDKLSTDILFGHNIGAKTLLTLSGVTQLTEVEQLDSSAESKSLIPNYIVSSLGDLVSFL